MITKNSNNHGSKYDIFLGYSPTILLIELCDRSLFMTIINVMFVINYRYVPLEYSHLSLCLIQDTQFVSYCISEHFYHGKILAPITIWNSKMPAFVLKLHQITGDSAVKKKNRVESQLTAAPLGKAGTGPKWSLVGSIRKIFLELVQNFTSGLVTYSNLLHQNFWLHFLISKGI